MREKEQKMQNQVHFSFRELVTRADLNKLNQFILGMTPQQVQDLIEAGDHMSLYLAISHNKINVLHWLLNLAPNIIKTDAFHSLLYHAVLNDNLTMVNELIKLAPGQVSIIRMIQKDNYSAFRNAAYQDNLEIVQRLIQCAPEYSIQMLDALARKTREKALDLMMEPGIRALVIPPSNDLRQVASNRESSMRDLSPMEISIIEKLSAHYQGDIHHLGGDAKILKMLHLLLIKRYQEHPATATNDKNEEIELPYDFESFRKLRLDPQTYAKALECYYQHPIHTALRYLSKPNLWMNPEANYILRDSSGAYSSFENHAPLIALMFLAARDGKTPGIDGFSVEARLNMFFKELSLIARAHNWDNYRTNPVTHKPEQYDDLTADKPSCPGGVNKRLLQAVHGHPLTKLLTEDLITQEILEFVETQFLDKITKDNVHELRQAWDDIINTGSTSSKVLECLNISVVCQRKFLEDMSDKYGDKLTIPHIKFLLSQFEPSMNFPNHAARFGGELDLDAMIDKKITSFSSLTGGHCLFERDDQVEPLYSQPQPSKY
jgi:hypothetical protein